MGDKKCPQCNIAMYIVAKIEGNPKFEQILWQCDRCKRVELSKERSD